MKTVHSLTTRAILWKAMRLGLKVKTPASMLVTVLSIPAALIPLLLSRQLQNLTDLLFGMTAGQGISMSQVMAAFVLLGAYFLLQMLFQFLSEYCLINDKHRTKLFIKEYTLLCYP